MNIYEIHVRYILVPWMFLCSGNAVGYMNQVVLLPHIVIKSKKYAPLNYRTDEPRHNK